MKDDTNPPNTNNCNTINNTKPSRYKSHDYFSSDRSKKGK